MAASHTQSLAGDPASRSACRTQPRSVSPLQPIFPAIETTAAHFGRVIVPMLQNHPHSPRPDLARKSVGRLLLLHDPILSRVGASRKPGAVHIATRYDRCAHAFFSAICIAAAHAFQLNQ